MSKSIISMYGYLLGKDTVLLWNAKDVSDLRLSHRVVGHLVGSMPNDARQNEFGLPLLLIPEETKLLIELGILHLRDISVLIQSLTQQEIDQFRTLIATNDQGLPDQRHHIMAESSVKSFVPMRSNCTAKWFNNGESYMSAVADAIEKAQHVEADAYHESHSVKEFERKQIAFDQSWPNKVYILSILLSKWLSAQIFLRRSTRGVSSLNDSSRLDKMLLKKAEEGVKIFLLVYRGEIKVPWIKYLIDLGNKQAKEILNHQNIVYILDPVVKLNNDIIWSHHEKLVIVDQTIAFVSGIDLCYGRWDNHHHRLMDNYEEPLEEQQDDIDSDVQFQTWVGLDYMNDFEAAYKHDNYLNPFTDYIDRVKNPRLPWHDIGCCVYGEVAKDVAKHFKQRYKFCQSDRPKSEFKGLSPGDSVHSQSLSITDPSTSNCACQVFRSASMWSAGIETEHSIQDAYISAIENAEHFVYIENQFFISSLDLGGGVKVTNRISEAIKDRIARAYKEKKKFRVILLIPLKPEFTGHISGSDNRLINMKETFNFGNFCMREVLYAELLTMSQKKYSIIQRLITEDGIPENEISEYFTVYGLRTFEYTEKGTPVTEIVYIHAKCMIVDDRLTIIGSANINDRSMKGDGDSEVVVCFQDQTFVDSFMNGVPYKAGEFAQSLRLNLFRQHMGLKPGDNDLIIDPLSDKFYQAWTKTAKDNNAIFKKVFGGEIIPCDGMKTYDKLNEHKKNKGLVESDAASTRHLLEQVKGNLVEFPLDFLEDTDMTSYTPDFLKPYKKGLLMFSANQGLMPDEATI